MLGLTMNLTLLAIAVVLANSAIEMPVELQAGLLMFAGKEPGAGRLCVRFDGKDPPKNVLDAANARYQLFVPGSSCRYVGYPEQAVEKKNRKQAQFLDVSVTSTHPIVFSVKYRAGAYSGHGWNVQAKRVDEVWKFEKEEGFWTE